jgi:hypothetical protein
MAPTSSDTTATKIVSHRHSRRFNTHSSTNTPAAPLLFVVRCEKWLGMSGEAFLQRYKLPVYLRRKTRDSDENCKPLLSTSRCVSPAARKAGCCCLTPRRRATSLVDIGAVSLIRDTMVHYAGLGRYVNLHSHEHEYNKTSFHFPRQLSYNLTHSCF